MIESSGRAVVKKTGKKRYQKPQLRRYGRISRITAGGSGASQEMMMMTNMMMFP